MNPLSNITWHERSRLEAIFLSALSASRAKWNCFVALHKMSDSVVWPPTLFIYPSPTLNFSRFRLNKKNTSGQIDWLLSIFIVVISIIVTLPCQSFLFLPFEMSTTCLTSASQQNLYEPVISSASKKGTTPLLFNLLCSFVSLSECVSRLYQYDSCQAFNKSSMKRHFWHRHCELVIHPRVFCPIRVEKFKVLRSTEINFSCLRLCLLNTIIE